ncbi:hypothetical protein F383_13871 [Gossypium arboreum]|uniref:Uncharacterized protein n=1 Tax=Gossypium arboreum TaxID=29729 RepID=A0A0B0NF14_GOSAR|nr:hypothetical protein F383_13871 [Gossypium arboreum]
MSYTSSQQVTQTSWHEYPIYFLKFNREFYYLYSHNIFSSPQLSNLCYNNFNTIQIHILLILGLDSIFLNLQ